MDATVTVGTVHYKESLTLPQGIAEQKIRKAQYDSLHAGKGHGK